MRLPHDLDWSSGSALSDHNCFTETPCPGCCGPARRETDTLDCFFDDLWCFLASCGSLDHPFAEREENAAWMPVDAMHTGFDTLAYVHLYRFLGAFLHDRGALENPEPVFSFHGHDMVLSEGRKMSKSQGNLVSPMEIVARHGSDALRLGIIWAAGPQRTVDWRDALVERAAVQLTALHGVAGRICGADPTSRER